MISFMYVYRKKINIIITNIFIDKKLQKLYKFHMASDADFKYARQNGCSNLHIRNENFIFEFKVTFNKYFKSESIKHAS